MPRHPSVLRLCGAPSLKGSGDLSFQKCPKGQPPPAACLERRFWEHEQVAEVSRGLSGVLFCASLCPSAQEGVMSCQRSEDGKPVLSPGPARAGLARSRKTGPEAPGGSCWKGTLRQVDGQYWDGPQIKSETQSWQGRDKGLPGPVSFISLYSLVNHRLHVRELRPREAHQRPRVTQLVARPWRRTPICEGQHPGHSCTLFWACGYVGYAG